MDAARVASCPSRTNSESVKHEDRYDKHGNPDQHGRYDKSGNFVFTPSERAAASFLGATLLVLARLLGPILDKLPYPGFSDAILGVAILGAFWIAVVGRANPDGD